MTFVLAIVPGRATIAAPSKYVKSLSVSKTKYTLTSGSKKTVKATVKTKGSVSKKVKISVSKADKSKVSVKVGKPNKKGVTKITITAKKVTQKKTARVKITTVSKNKKNKKITKTIKITVTPKKSQKDKSTTETTTETTSTTETPTTQESTTEESTTEEIVHNEVVIDSITTQYDEALTIKDGYFDYDDIARQLGVVLHYSDGTSQVVDEYYNGGYIKNISGVDTQKVGDYVAVLTANRNGKEVSISINVSVCEEQEKQGYRFFSNGNIARIIQYVGEEEENLAIPEKIDGADVIGGFWYNLLPYHDGECKIKTITIPKNWRLFDNLGGTSALESYYVNDENLYFSSVDGVLFNKNQTFLYAYSDNKVTEAYRIPDSVTEVRIDAFRNPRCLEKVIIPKSVEKMGRAIPGVCLYWTNFNAENSLLKEIVVEEGNQHYKSIDGVLFADYEYEIDYDDYVESCRVYSLLVYPICKEEKEYRIPDGVNAIYGEAFVGAKYLEKLTIPSGINSWGYPLFWRSSIKEIYLDIEEEYDYKLISADIFDDGRTIYVRNAEVKAYIEKLLEQEGYMYLDSCIISDNYSW